MIVRNVGKEGQRLMEEQKPKCPHFIPKSFLPYHSTLSYKWCDHWRTISRGDVAGHGVLTCMEPTCMFSEVEWFHKHIGVCPTKGKRV